MRKQFNLQDWLKDKSQKVETSDGRPVKIISFEMTDTNDCPIAAQFRLCAGTPVVYLFDKEGHYKGEGNSDYDLFIVTPEEELTDFENAFGRAMMEVPEPEEKEEWYQFLKEKAAELLFLAREQLIKDGYVIEKKAFHDAVEKIDDKYKAEMSIEYSLHCKIENRTRHAVMNWDTFQKVAQKFINIGKDEALKDLPRWKKIGQGNNYSSETKFCINGRYLEMNDTLNYLYEISLKDLERLPKEDKK